MKPVIRNLETGQYLAPGRQWTGSVAQAEVFSENDARDELRRVRERNDAKDKHTFAVVDADKFGDRVAQERSGLPHASRRYRCTRCGYTTDQDTNHTGPTWSSGHYNVCPRCPPWAKYPEFGGMTRWECVEPLIRVEVTDEYPTRYAAFDRPGVLFRHSKPQQSGGHEWAVFHQPIRGDLYGQITSYQDKYLLVEVSQHGMNKQLGPIYGYNYAQAERLLIQELTERLEQ